MNKISYRIVNHLTPEEEAKLIPISWGTAVEVICLNDCLCDLEDELKERKMFRFGVKHTFNKMKADIIYATDGMYKVLKRIDSDVARDYLDYYQMMAEKIDESIYVEGLQRHLSIAISLCQEMIRNNGILHKFGVGIDFISGHPLSMIERSLKQLNEIATSTKTEQKDLTCIIHNLFQSETASLFSQEVSHKLEKACKK